MHTDISGVTHYIVEIMKTGCNNILHKVLLTPTLHFVFCSLSVYNIP